MAFTFTSDGARKAATNLDDSANKIEELLDRLDNLTRRVKDNYDSEASQEILNSLEKLKSKGPEFKEAVSNCSHYLRDTVAPSYEKVENEAELRVTE